MMRLDTEVGKDAVKHAKLVNSSRDVRCARCDFQTNLLHSFDSKLLSLLSVFLKLGLLMSKYRVLVVLLSPILFVSVSISSTALDNN